MPPDWLIPDWPAPAQVVALMTTRNGGVSRAPYASFNTASHVGDDPAAVAHNRAVLGRFLPGEPLWLNQVHGARVVDAATCAACPDADASVAHGPGRVCVVQTADCLPVLFCDRDGSVVSAAHAGWRGLAAGVLEATVAAMQAPASRILAWLGAAIGADAFEVGAEVRAAFIARHPQAEAAFRALAGDKWCADLYALARLRLAQAGVERVYGGGLCTVRDAARFYSFRRDGQTGRMASAIGLRRAP